MTESVKPTLIQKSSLAGHLLIATQVVQDSCFARSVVYLCAHNETGAMGVIINYPVEHVHLTDVLEQLEIESMQSALDRFPIHFGGPVEANRGFVVHSDEYKTEGSLITKDGISVTSNIAVLQDMAAGKGPAKGMLVLGYAGWGAGQLESEIETGSWITVEANKKLVFDTENDVKWNTAISLLGFDMGHFSTNVGHA